MNPINPPPVIYLIDDSLTICKIIQTCLGREGYRVESFPDPIEALRALFQGRENAPPVLLIIDIGLTRIDGYEVMRRVRGNEMYLKTPIIALTGRHGVLDHLKARLAGADLYMTKPFKTQELVAAVRDFLASTPAE